LCTIERKIHELNSHVDYRIRELLPPPSASKEIVKAPMFRIGSTVTLAIFLCGGFCALRAQPVAHARIDSTSSVDRVDLANGLRLLSESSAALTITFGITRWEFIPFSDDAWTAAPTAAVDMPNLPSVSCGRVLPSEADFFSGVAQARQEEARKKCNQIKSTAQQQYEAMLLTKVTEWRKTIIPPQLVSNRCTSFFDLLTRVSMIQGPAVELIFSDGIETCRAPQNVPPPSPNVKAVLVLLNTLSRPARMSPAQEFLERKREVQRFAPWLQIIPTWNLTVANIAQQNTQAPIVKLVSDQK
jgi:hypothetical protein